jgi:hypothetical protein
MIKKFYNAQKSQSLLFLFSGSLAILLSIYFLIKNENAFSIGFSFPFLVFGIFQILLGYKTFSKTNQELAFAILSAKNNVSQIVGIEIPKINSILKIYNLKNYIFLGLNGLSIALFIVFASMQLFKGIGLGLFVQSLIHISSLYFENNRSQIYIKWLNDYYN